MFQDDSVSPASGNDSWLRSIVDDLAPSDLEVLVLPNGSFVGGTEENRPSVPRELIDLALGSISEREPYAAFIWIGEPDGRCWRTSITLVEQHGVATARLQVRILEKPPHALSRRELEIITLIAAGGSNDAISQALTLSLRTVTTHCGNIMRKLNVQSRAGVQALAFGEGLLALPFPVSVPWLNRLRLERLVRSGGVRTPISTPMKKGKPVMRIGALIPIRGRGAADGQEMLNGAELALAEINALGGIHGRVLQLESAGIDVDDLGSVRRAMNRLRAAEVDAVASGYLRHQLEAMNLAAEEGIPFLHSSASSALERVVAENSTRYHGAFQCCPPDSGYAPGFVRFVSQLRDDGPWRPRSDRLVVVHQNDWEFVDFGLEEAEAVAAANSWELVTLSVGDSDIPGRWEDGAFRAERHSPAAIMLASYFPSEHQQFFTRLHAEGSEALRYAIYAPSMPEYRQRLGELSEGMLWATSTGTYSDDIGQGFAHRYRNRFGQAPGRSHAGIAYDKVQILADAWRRTDGARDLSSVVDRLSETRYRGVNGSYYFHTPGRGTLALGSDHGDPSLAQAHTIFQIRQGRNILVSPAMYSVGEFHTPYWAETRGAA